MKEGHPYLTLDRLRSMAHEVAGRIGCRMIVLFGSAARAGDLESEDLDLGVLVNDPLDPVAVTNVFIQTLRMQKVDVVDLRRADPLLMMFVARDGIPLFEERLGEFARFASLAVRRYADTRKFRELERREIRDFVSRSKVES